MTEDNKKQDLNETQDNQKENVESNNSEKNKKDEKKSKNIELTKQLNDCKEQLALNQKKLDELNDKYLRVIAEYDNFRKRTIKEKEDAYNSAYSDALSEFLPMVDNLERAIKYDSSGNLLEGINMILSQFNQMLQKLGIESYGQAGETFDPNIHNAIFHVEDEKLGENVIAEVLLKGYKRGDKILRFAMVKVAN